VKISDIEYGTDTVVDLVPVVDRSFGRRIPPLAEVQLLPLEGSSEAQLRLGDSSWTVTGGDERHRAVLRSPRLQNVFTLAWVVTTYPKAGPSERVTVETRAFVNRLSWPQLTEFGVDERIVEDVRRKRRSLLSVDAVLKWLADQLLIPEESRNNKRIIASASPNLEGSKLNAFRLFGNRIAADILRGADDRLRVHRIVEARRREQDGRRAMFLVEGDFQFVDSTVAGQLKGAARSMLDEIVQSADSYLKLWGDYNSIERDNILERAKEFGWVNYVNSAPLPSGCWRFALSENSLTRGIFSHFSGDPELELEAADEIPEELLDAPSVPTQDVYATRQPHRKPFWGTCTRIDRSRRFLEIKPPDGEDMKPPSEGVIFVSLSGDRYRLQRRERARDSIASAECPMRQLGLLIEGKPVLVRSPGRDKPLSAATRKVFGGEPTDRQIEALNIALNTPDIALIQGPPGTGKTRVIAALESRLAELGENRVGISGQTLLSSFQHDAVENAAAQTVVLGLPAIKVGTRRGEGEPDDGVERWRHDRVEAVRADLACETEYPLARILKRVQDLEARYLLSLKPDEETRPTLESLIELTRGVLPDSICDRLLELRDSLRPRTTPSGTDSSDLEVVLKALHAIRTDPTAFSDDGPIHARKALIRLQTAHLVKQAEESLLVRAAEWLPDAPLDFLDELARLRETFIDQLTAPKNGALSKTLNSDLLEILKCATEKLYSQLRESAGGPASVLYDYLDDLENDVEGVRDTIKNYTAVLAATCQQAGSKSMHELKAGSDDSERTVFDSVIIDEAARANPLDLFIPMAMAERRIVLVGDHRQLPHLLDPDVDAELDKSVADATREALKRSLFERLFQSLRERERADGIKRTVTLNAQYRMHPVLGQFVSDTFYKPFGEEFESPRDAAEFQHDLSKYEGAVAAWVDVPFTHGAEQGVGTSKRRPVEAEWIANEVKCLMLDRPHLSFGVITFYSAQKEDLLRAMEPIGLARRSDEGALHVAPEWSEMRGNDEKLKERLRVGTVDSFQGKEFDVVLLSMTRSNQLPCRPAEDRLQRAKYGHLMLENRLCVAMSRQQRLLIVVGDAAMLRGEGAQEAINGLVSFRKFCEGAHGICLSA
jgi:hypothetical protein